MTINEHDRQGSQALKRNTVRAVQTDKRNGKLYVNNSNNNNTYRRMLAAGE